MKCPCIIYNWFKFNIHWNTLWKFLSHNLKLIQLARDQPVQVQGVVKPAIQRNAYFAETGIMLTYMIEDPYVDVRRSGIEMIKKARSKPPKVPKSNFLKGMRKHEIPVLNWNASKWTEIVDLEKVKIWEPRILRKLSLEQVEAAMDFLLSQVSLSLTNCWENGETCHWSVWRSLWGEKQQEKAVAVLASRKSRKAYDTKKDYIVN